MSTTNSPAVSSVSMVGSGTMEGTLSKWTNVMKGWQYRFFVLDENAGLLSYYTVCMQVKFVNVCVFVCVFPDIAGNQALQYVFFTRSFV